MSPVASLQHFSRTAPSFLVAAGAAVVMEILVTRQSYVFLPAAAAVVVLCHLAYAFWFRQIAERQDTAPALT